jgi:hypothetical protein
MDLFGQIVQSVLLTEAKAPTVSDINDAINGLTPVEIRYTAMDKNNKAVGRRIIYPVAYGLTKAGNPVVRAFEPYGDTHTKVPAWKFFLMSGIRQWRVLKGKTFKGEKLEGFNKNGDLSMSAVYNIANIDGKPKDFKPTNVKVGAVTKTDINPKEKEKEVQQIANLYTDDSKMYTSKEIIDDLLKGTEHGKEKTAQQAASQALGGIKSQLDGEKRMVSPQMLAQIEKDNARRKIAQAKKKGIKLDNEQELLDIIKGTPASKTIAPKTQPITKKDIISGGGQSSEQKPQENLPTKPFYKDDVANVYDISQDDIEKIRKQWGIK